MGKIEARARRRWRLLERASVWGCVRRIFIGEDEESWVAVPSRPAPRVGGFNSSELVIERNPVAIEARSGCHLERLAGGSLG